MVRKSFSKTIGLAFLTFVVASANAAQPIVKMPLSPMPGTSQSFGNLLNYPTNACLFKGYHTGVDYAPVSAGQAVMAIADGNVIKTGKLNSSGSLGGYVVIDHPQLGYRSYYLHTNPAVNAGQKVVAGQKIATIAATTAVGKHLHLEMQKANFHVRDKDGNEKLFVGKNTSPIGSCGYLTRQRDLSLGWINPAEFLKHPTSGQNRGQEQGGENLEVEETPRASEQIARSLVVQKILKALADKRYTFNGSLDAQASAAGLITSGSLLSPQQTASRMEVALFLHRMLKKFAPASVASSSSTFSIDEFNNGADTNANEYLSVVNTLTAVGIINGQRDSLGEMRFYPTRKASISEVDSMISRSMSKISPAPAVAPTPSNPTSAKSAAVNVNITGLSINPTVGIAGKAMTFTASVNTTQGVTRAELVFPDAGVVEAMSQSGNSYSRTRIMQNVGTNRPYQVRLILSNGQTKTQAGTFTIKAR